MELVKITSESGLQIQTRIAREKRIKNISLANLNDRIFLDGGPRLGQVIEILGEANVGKSYLIEEMIAKVILPLRFGGKEAGVFLVSCGQSLDVSRLYNVMKKHATQSSSAPSPQELRESFRNVCLYQCYSHDDIEIALHKIEQRLAEPSSNIALVVLDHIGAFYWLEQTDTSNMKISTYLRNLTEIFEKIGERHAVTVIYTRLKYFTSEVPEKRRTDRCYIELVETAADDDCEQTFKAFVNEGAKTKIAPYRIKEDGMHWDVN